MPKRPKPDDRPPTCGDEPDVDRHLFEDRAAVCHCGLVTRNPRTNRMWFTEPGRGRADAR